MTPGASSCVCSPVGYESKSQVNSARAACKQTKKESLSNENIKMTTLEQHYNKCTFKHPL